MALEKLKIMNEYWNHDVFAMSHGVHRGVSKKGNWRKRTLYKKTKKLTPNIKYDLYGMDNHQPIWADNFINKISKSKWGST